MHQIPETELQGPFREVYESLYLLQHDYQEHFKTLQQEINDRIQAEHRAAELSQIKSRFLGNVSHDLRTPLNAIIGFTHLLLKGRTGELNPKQQDFLQRVRDNGMHLLALINDVLDISKIESGTLSLHFEKLEMPPFLESLLEPLKLTAQSKQIQLQLELEPNMPTHLNSDPDRLRQILTNLVNNALKFTAEGHVILRYCPGPSEAFPVALEVEDTGIGIAKADQSKIFGDFVQVHQGHYAGVGLGLSICASLVQLLGYQLELESELGQGTLFRVLLPRSSQI